ncbi:hypothetical protein T09_7094 [Trichinella sp. T9]|nr:hypothetical protein T09_7094 [Trichinella sp. T9]
MPIIIAPGNKIKKKLLTFFENAYAYALMLFIHLYKLSVNMNLASCMECLVQQVGHQSQAAEDESRFSSNQTKQNKTSPINDKLAPKKNTDPGKKLTVAV